MNLNQTRNACRRKEDCVEHLSSEKDIHAMQFMLDVIEFAYKLPLLQIPTLFTARNNSSALEQSAFVENATNDLIRQGCVTKVF